MLIAVFVLLLALFVVGLHADDADLGGPLIGVAITGLVIVFVVLVAVLFFHCGDVAMVRSGSALVDVQEVRIASLRKDLEDIQSTDVPSASLMNADSPIESIVEQISAATAQLADARTKIAQAKVDIEGRKVGPFWIVVKIYGDK